MGLRVLVPDVNRSVVDFSAVDGQITFGMSAVRNVGEVAVEAIIEEREAKGEFVSFSDFVNGHIGQMLLSGVRDDRLFYRCCPETHYDQDAQQRCYYNNSHCCFLTLGF